MGNHEFDAGTSTLEDLIAADARGAAGPAADRYVGTLFPYLSANPDFSSDYSLNSLFNAALVDATSNGGINTIAPMATFTMDGGEKVAVIGATKTILATISSSGAVVANGGGSDVLIVTVSGFASLSGGSGTDTLIGGVTDLMAGGSGDDLLIPFGGRKVMIGASGADLFLLADTHLPAFGGTNIVTNFVSGEDKLVFGGGLVNDSSEVSFVDQGRNTGVIVAGVEVAQLLGVSSSSLSSSDVITEDARLLSPLMSCNQSWMPCPTSWPDP